MTRGRGHARRSLNRLASAALDAALDDGQPRRRGGSPTRALMTGVAIATVARVAIRRADRHPLAVVDALRDRIGGRDFLDEDVDAETEFDDDYEPEEEEDEEEEEEENEEEEEDEPEDDDEPEDEFDAESGEERDEDELTDGDGRLDPAARPPEPPPGRDEQEKATAGRG